MNPLCNYHDQFECRQCHNFVPHPSYKRKGTCRIHKRQYIANRKACNYFIVLKRCPVCEKRPIDFDDVMGLCKECQVTLQKDKEEAYT